MIGLLRAACLGLCVALVPPGASPAMAQTGDPIGPAPDLAPDLRPGPVPVLIPDPALVRWEILNRFSPFAALDRPEETFARYAFLPGESAQDWHKRLWQRDGAAFASPYAEALRTGRPTPWDTQAQLPAAATLGWIRGERDPSAQIAVTLRYPFNGPCRWEAGATIVLAPNCAQPTLVRLPQAGLTLSLRLAGSPATGVLQITPRHTVILGLGDSYASGEGNPDQPAVWAQDFAPPAGETRWLTRAQGRVQAPAWLDGRCNRSFFSHQSLVALARASEDPHLLVSFVHLACSGAEIFDGILAAQNAPAAAEGLNRYAQINAAQIALCQVDVPRNYLALDTGVAARNAVTVFARRNGADLYPLDGFDVSTRAQRDATGLIEPRSGLLDCPTGALRAPDQILLSIGGNDIGFGELVRYFLVPVTFDLALVNRLVLPKICPDPKYRYGDPNLLVTTHCAALDAAPRENSGSLIGASGDPKGLQARYAFLIRVLRHYLEVHADQIAVVQYPDPLRQDVFLPPSLPERARPGAAVEMRAEETLANPEAALAPPPVRRDPDCTRLLIRPELVPGSPAGLDPLSPWAALSATDPLEITTNWAFNLRPSEALNMLRQIEDLRNGLTNMALDEGLVFACAGRDAFVGRGWWAGERLNLPSHGSGTERWPVSDWQPYAYTETGRAIRTANDSFLTQTAVHGTVHPNLVGHTLLADALRDRLSAP